MKQKLLSGSGIITLYISLITGFILLNLVFLFFFRGQVDSIVNLKRELNVTTTGNVSLRESERAYESYKDDVELLAAVFPDESSISDFISTLERRIRSHTSEYSLRLTSPTPLTEGDMLYLLMTVVVRLDFASLKALLSDFEAMPYMTHITGISSKGTEGFAGLSETTVNLKVYVKKPFSAK